MPLVTPYTGPALDVPSAQESLQQWGASGSSVTRRLCRGSIKIERCVEASQHPRIGRRPTYLARGRPVAINRFSRPLTAVPSSCQRSVAQIPMGRPGRNGSSPVRAARASRGPSLGFDKAKRYFVRHARRYRLEYDRGRECVRGVEQVPGMSEIHEQRIGPGPEATPAALRRRSRGTIYSG